MERGQLGALPNLDPISVSLGNQRALALASHVYRRISWRMPLGQIVPECYLNIPPAGGRKGSRD